MRTAPRHPKASSPLPATLPQATTRFLEAFARSAGFCRLAGVDEAGRGPWAGPVVAAAVILRTPLLPIRIDDSKRLSAPARARAFDVIMDHAEVGFGMASAEEIDQANILQASLLAMSRAILDLPSTPDLVLVDGSTAPMLRIPCWPLVQGDRRSYLISCASIMAKVLRDRLMEFYHGLYPRYAFHRHKGYGTLLHAARLRQFGPSVLHRHTFRPVRDDAARRHVGTPPHQIA